MCNMQRDDLPSRSVLAVHVYAKVLILENSNYSAEMTDRPREGAPMLSGSYQGQGSSGQPFVFPRPSLRDDSADDVQGNSLCAQLGEFHFTPQYSSHGHATVDAPTAINENSYVRPSVY